MIKPRKSSKIYGEHCMWKIEGCGLQYCTKFAGKYIALITHKNKIRAVLLDEKYGKRKFHGTNIINPSDARLIIGWLARYIAQADPDPVSLAIASTKAHARLIEKDQNNIAKELGL